MITSVKDLEYILGWKTDRGKAKDVQKSLFIELDPTEQLVIDHLNGKEKQLLDVLALECDLSIQKTVTILLQLELKGLVKSLPGKWYQSIP